MFLLWSFGPKKADKQNRDACQHFEMTLTKFCFFHWNSVSETVPATYQSDTYAI